MFVFSLGQPSGNFKSLGAEENGQNTVKYSEMLILVRNVMHVANEKKMRTPRIEMMQKISWIFGKTRTHLKTAFAAQTALESFQLLATWRMI